MSAADSTSSTSARPLSFGLWFRLSFMMFLQYAIWGAWLPLLFPFLAGHRGFTPGQIGDMFAVGALGAILAPWIAGQIADRYFNTERYLAVAHVLGGLLVFQLSWISTYWAFLGFSFIYSLIYAPTLSLTNSISFHHLPDRDRDFGRVRVWGTIGWIVVGIGVGQWLAFTHSPEKATATQALILRLLNEDSRRELRETYTVTYKDSDGKTQTASGYGDPTDYEYLNALVAGTEPPELESILMNLGTYEEPQLLPIATDQIVSVENHLKNLENSLQPGLLQEFYATVDRTAGREPRNLEELSATEGAPPEPPSGGSETAEALTIPPAWIPLSKGPLDDSATDAQIKERQESWKQEELKFADKVAQEFADLDDFDVFAVIDRKKLFEPGEAVYFEQSDGTLLQRILVEKSASGLIVRNTATGQLEAYSGVEGPWSAELEYIVGKEVVLKHASGASDISFVPSTRIMTRRPGDPTSADIATATGANTVLVPTKAIVSKEQYGLFRKSALDAYAGEKEQAGMSDAFIVSAVLGVILGLFCFTLPKTPPQKGQQSSATSEALGEIRHQPLLALFLLAVPISCIHQFYFVHAATFLGEFQRQAQGLEQWINSIFGVGGGGLMTIGQMTEIAVLAFIPLFAKKYSRKTLLATGIVAYGLRMFLFAYVDMIPLPPLITLILGVALHGLCFGSFIFVAFMIVDEETTGDVRASAQSLFNLVIVGIGIIVGSKIAGWVAEWASASGTMDYKQLFSIPMWASVGCLAFLIFFYPRKSKKLAPVQTVE